MHKSNRIYQSLCKILWTFSAKLWQASTLSRCSKQISALSLQTLCRVAAVRLSAVTMAHDYEITHVQWIHLNTKYQAICLGSGRREKSTSSSQSDINQPISNHAHIRQWLNRLPSIHPIVNFYTRCTIYPLYSSCLLCKMLYNLPPFQLLLFMLCLT